ncbi:unnamed protein product, partial [Brassica rapa]
QFLSLPPQISIAPPLLIDFDLHDRRRRIVISKAKVFGFQSPSSPISITPSSLSGFKAEGVLFHFLSLPPQISITPSLSILITIFAGVRILISIFSCKVRVTRFL